MRSSRRAADANFGSCQRGNLANGQAYRVIEENRIALPCVAGGDSERVRSRGVPSQVIEICEIRLPAGRCGDSRIAASLLFRQLSGKQGA